MNSQVKKLDDLKRKAEQMRQEHDRAQGRLDESQARLKDEFGVDSLDGARKLLKKLEKEEQGARDAFNVALDEFKEKWDEILGES